jgi:hypothetical protein
MDTYDYMVSAPSQFDPINNEADCVWGVLQEAVGSEFTAFPSAIWCEKSDEEVVAIFKSIDDVIAEDYYGHPNFYVWQHNFPDYIRFSEQPIPILKGIYNEVVKRIEEFLDYKERNNASMDAQG